MVNKYLDIYVDYKLVESYRVTSKEGEQTVKSDSLAKFLGENVQIKTRLAVEEVEVVSGDCPGGVCPVRTTPKKVEVDADAPAIEKVEIPTEAVAEAVVPTEEAGEDEEAIDTVEEEAPVKKETKKKKA